MCYQTMMTYRNLLFLRTKYSTGNIYFTNAFDVEVFIEVIRLDGAFRKVILKEPQGQPRSIAVNPIKR